MEQGSLLFIFTDLGTKKTEKSYVDRSEISMLETQEILDNSNPEAPKTHYVIVLHSKGLTLRGMKGNKGVSLYESEAARDEAFEQMMIALNPVRINAQFYIA
jgi:hypothetical protein